MWFCVQIFRSKRHSSEIYECTPGRLSCSLCSEVFFLSYQIGALSICVHLQAEQELNQREQLAPCTQRCYTSIVSLLALHKPQNKN